MKKLLFVFALTLAFGALSAQKAEQYNYVDRDRTMPLVCKDNGEIIQGSLIIGKYKIPEQKPESVTNVLTALTLDWAEFYLPDNVIVCKATKVAGKDNEYSVYTYKDSKTTTYTTEGNQLNSLTQYVVNKGYL